MNIEGGLMVCPKCKTENPDGSRFCSNCGTSLTFSPSTQGATSPEVSPLPQTSKSNKGTKILIVVVAGVGFLFMLAVVRGIYHFLSSMEKEPQVEQPLTNNQNTTLPTTPEAIVPNSEPSPSPAPTNQTKKENRRHFETMEEALTFALTDSGMEYAENARIKSINLLYTPTSKQWTFEFRSRINPHKKGGAGGTLYNYPNTRVKIKNTGEFKVSSYTYESGDGGYTSLPKPSEVALSSYLDLAKQKVEGMGFKPGNVILADYTTCPYCNYTGKWVINVVLAGEEEKDEKAAKEITFRDGVLKDVRDTIVTVHQTLF